MSDAVYRANEANRLLEEPLLVEALDRIEQDAMDEAVNASYWSLFGDRKRRRALDRVRIVRDFRLLLRAAITTGKIRINTVV